MTLLKDNDYKEINVALLSLEADIKNKITNFDTSVIDRQLAEINSRIDKINAGGNNSSAVINDIREEIEDINSKLNGNSAKIENIEQKLSDIFSAENKVTDFNTTTDSGIYYWVTDAANRPTDYGVLLVNKYDGGDSASSLWINQIAYGTDNKIYFRQNINSTGWTEWKAVAFDGEIIAKKVANALTVNGKTYDGSSAVNAGVQTVTNGGTGVTTQADINKAFIGNLDVGTSDVTDGTEFVSSWASNNGFAETTDGALNKPYKRKFSAVWGYIKGKISSVLGLTKDNYGGKASTAGTADKTVNDITIDIPYVGESGQYVIPLGNIPQPGSTETGSAYWDITGFFSIIRSYGHAGAHITFEAGHGYSHRFTTYAYLDEDNFTEEGPVGMSIKAFKYDGNWWLGLWINTQWQGYYGKMTITYSSGRTAKPTCILYNSVSNGVANKEIYDSIQDIPSWWWRRRTIYNPTIFTQYVTAPGIQANSKMVIPIGAPSSLEDGCIWIER